MQRRLIAAGLLVLVGLFVLAWQLPSLLRAMPSRYVARLPEPVQALGVREHVAVLPTAAFTSDVNVLLEGDQAPETKATERAPATPTPPPTRPSTAESSEITQADAEVASPTATATNTVAPMPMPTDTPVPLPETARLEGIQHRFQTWNNCGPATLAMSLTYFDVFHTQEQTASILKPDPEDRNVTPEEMVAYVNEQTEFSAMTRTNGNLYALRRLIGEGFPVIVEIGIDPPGEYAWMDWYGHYLLVVAYDSAEEAFWVYDSWFGTSEVPGENADDEGRLISFETLDSYWRQFNRNYVVLFAPEQRAQVSAIIGEQMVDEVMWQAALERVRSEINAEPDNAFLWFNLGTVYNALGDYERGAAAFDKARSIGLPWRMLWYQFGPYEAYYQTGRYEDVILLADVTLQDRPYFEESYYYKGLAQLALGDSDGAAENLQRAVDFNPNFSPAAEALQKMSLAN